MVPWLYELLTSHPLSSRMRFFAPTSSFSSFALGTSTIVLFLSFVVRTRPSRRDEKDTESDENGMVGLGLRVRDVEGLGCTALLEAVSAVSIEMTPSRTPYPRTRSSMRLRGCIRSKRSRKLSSRSRWSSESSAHTSSRTLRAMKRSMTRVSRWRDCMGERERGPAGCGVGGEASGKGSEVYGKRTRVL